MKSSLAEFARDVGRAARMWARRPGIAATCVLTLALGVGTTTLMFTGINGLLVRPMPYAQADRLHEVERLDASGSPWSVSFHEWTAWRAETRSFEHLAAWFKRGYTASGFGDAERVAMLRTSSELFDMLGVEPLLGRTLQPSDEPLDAPRVVVLGYARWQAWGADPAIIGSDVLLDGLPHEVIGVLPETFWFPNDRRDGYVNLRIDPALAPADSRFLEVTGRLAGGVAAEAAAAELAGQGAALPGYPEVRLTPLRESFHPDGLRRSLQALGGAALVLLLLCSANVANLLLALATERNREFCLRAALGAPPRRLARQVLIESLLLALPGIALGVLACIWGVELIGAHWVPFDFVQMQNVEVDGAALAFAAIVALVTALTAGAAPALRAARADVVRSLQETDQRGGGGHPQRLRDVLVLVQVSAALVLLVGAALMARSSLELTSHDLGFDVDRVGAARVVLTHASYAADEDVVAYFDAARARAAELPGAQAASCVVALPMSGSWGTQSFVLEHDPRTHPEPRTTAMDQVVGPGYLRTTGMPLLAGRAFDDADDAQSEKVCLISRSLAESMIFSEPLGVRLRFVTPDAEEPWWTVVGIVEEVNSLSPRSSPWPTVYRPYAQAPSRSMSIVVRAAGSARTLLEPLRATLDGIDPTQPAFGLNTLVDERAELMGSEFVTARLFTLFGVLALLLAVTGVYGVTAYNVVHRTRELGIRLALGARPAQVVRLVVLRSLKLGLAGLALGLVGAWFLSDALRTLLFGVHPADPLTYVGVAALLLAATLAAAWLPARRAARMQPMDALRSE